MAARPNLMNVHDQTPEGVLAALKRQIDADATYARVEVETLKAELKDQIEEIMIVKKNTIHHNGLFERINEYTDGAKKRIVAIEEKAKWLENGTAEEFKKLREIELVTKLDENWKKTEIALADLRTNIDVEILDRAKGVKNDMEADMQNTKDIFEQRILDAEKMSTRRLTRRSRSTRM